MIDLALPYEFKSAKLNNKFHTLRPLMVNFSRYTVEKTSMYMESFVFHESRDDVNKKHKKLYIESSKQFYEKPFVHPAEQLRIAAEAQEQEVTNIWAEVEERRRNAAEELARQQAEQLR